MKPNSDLEKLLKAFYAKQRSAIKTTTDFDDTTIAHALQAQSTDGRHADQNQSTWRRIMHSRITKLAAAALIAIVAFIGGIVFLAKPNTVYALNETARALRNIRYIHVTLDQPEGDVCDERWIEIGSDGLQARYRQEWDDMVIVDDGKTLWEYYKKKNTAVAYDSSQKNYQWFANLGQLFRDLADPCGARTIEIERNAPYNGRTAHRIRLLKLHMDCYVDPATALPISVGPFKITYEEPAADTFMFEVPSGVTVVDTRPGAKNTEEPEWLKTGPMANEYFDKGRKALAQGEFIRAADLLGRVVAMKSQRNWAWYWLGVAHYHLGQYDLAVSEFTTVIDMFSKFGIEAPYARLARGLANAARGSEQSAREDLLAVLPTMIEALRSKNVAMMFDYADDPLYKGRTDRQRAQIAKSSAANMIRRLRKITSKSLGFDTADSQETKVPEPIIAAWERWLKESPTIQVDPTYELEFVMPQ